MLYKYIFQFYIFILYIYIQILHIPTDRLQSNESGFLSLKDVPISLQTSRFYGDILRRYNTKSQVT